MTPSVQSDVARALAQASRLEGVDYVLARAGQSATPALAGERLQQVLHRDVLMADAGDHRTTSTRDVVLVGSLVGLTSRQLDQLAFGGRSSSWSSTCRPCSIPGGAMVTSPR